MSTPTHLSSGSVVVSVDELTTDDLAHLLDLKRSEPEHRRAVEDEELCATLWRLVHQMPRKLGAQIADALSDANPRVVLSEYFGSFLMARFGAASVRAFGYAASVAA